ncbi:sodium channel protein Nach-like [Colias croceus]|uniref:sodium channel protein Nach-like n=1 Tax=Colias crocea TaxID=72248 RepID=UPI001E27EA08|nr:sodium channel protein Nach-like [Colias croceus]
MSNLHGISMMCSPRVPLTKRLFWLFIWSVCVFGAWSVLKSSLSLYSSKVIAYNVDTNSLEWDTPFPAVTLCETLDNSRINNYLKSNNLPSAMVHFYKHVSYWTIKYCRLCVSCERNVTCSDDFIHHITRMRANCTELLTDCWWGGEHFKCCERFRPIKTEYGVCFSFNSELSGNKSEILLVNRKIGTPKLVFSTINSVLVKIHASDDTVYVDMEELLGRSNSIPLMANSEITLSVEQTVNDAAVTSVKPNLRDCLFKNEMPTYTKDWPFSFYSVTACMLYCKAITQYQLCNCTYHFISSIVNMPPCDINGLACLTMNKDEFSKYNCTCPMRCEETTYKLIHMSYRRSTKQLDSEIPSSRTVVRLLQLPSIRYRRFVIRDNLGLMVDIGGVGGVFFGASLLSFIEFVYLLCIRRGS